MKTLSLSRPLILIMIGLPGSGKTFFARQFSEMFSAPSVSYDRLRSTIFIRAHFTPEEQELLRNVAEYQIHELVKTHRSFIVDGGCNQRPERQKLEKLAKAHGYETLTIWVQTDESTCRSRATKRNPKRPDDAISASVTESQWADMAKRLNQPNREPYMVISGKHAFSTQAKMVLRKLTSPHIQEVESVQQQERSSLPVRRPESRPTQTRPNQPGSAPRRNVLIS